MKVKTAELIGPALDWAVASCMGNGIDLDDPNEPWLTVDGFCEKPLHRYTPSTDWWQGGPLIEGEKIHLQTDGDNIYWWAKHPAYRPKKRAWVEGPTPLVAAMRCFVSSKLGDEVEIPEELLT